jgi:hypothetical protein
MQLNVDLSDVDDRNQNNAQSVKEFLCRLPVQGGVDLELWNPQVEWCSLLLPWIKITASLSDTVTPMRYREVIRAPLWLLVIIYFFFLSLVISIWAALGNNSAIVSLVVLTLTLITLYFKSGLVLEVDDSEIRVGRAHLSREFFGSIVALDNQQLRRVRTRDADPAAFLAIRFWSPRAVQLFVSDNRDQTPYWLISTSRPEKLLVALKD